MSKFKSGALEFRRWFRYWTEGVKLSKERHEMIVLIIAGLLKVAGIWAKSTGYFVGFLDEKYIDLMSNWVAGGLAVYALLWMPFRRHEQQEMKYAEERKSLETKIANLEEAKKKSEDHKQFLSILGVQHIMLRERREAIQKMWYMGYTETYKESFERARLDAETYQLLCDITDVLESHIGSAAVAIFKDTTTLKLTPQDDPYSELGTKKAYWQAVLDRLDHTSNQLMKIIEGLK